MLMYVHINERIFVLMNQNKCISLNLHEWKKTLFSSDTITLLKIKIQVEPIRVLLPVAMEEPLYVPQRAFYSFSSLENNIFADALKCQ